MDKGAVLVTGASGGIGRAIALELIALNFPLGIHHRKGDVAMLERRCADAGVPCRRYRADLRDEKETVELAHAFLADFPVPAGLVNNAGLYPRSDLGAIGVDEWDEVMAVNLRAPFILSREIAPSMKEGSSIVNISSVMAFVGSSRGAHYSAAKAGLLGLSKSLAKELAPAVRVNCVAPGAIDTEMIGMDNPRKRKERENEIPAGRVGNPAEIAKAVAFLLSSDSSYMTGTVLHANGGWAMP